MTDKKITTLRPANNFKDCISECAACDYTYVNMGGTVIRIYSCKIYGKNVSPANGKGGLQ